MAGRVTARSALKHAPSGNIRRLYGLPVESPHKLLSSTRQDENIQPFSALVYFVADPGVGGFHLDFAAVLWRHFLGGHPRRYLYPRKPLFAGALPGPAQFGRLYNTTDHYPDRHYSAVTYYRRPGTGRDCGLQAHRIG